MAAIDTYEGGQTIDQYKVIRLIASTQNSQVYLVSSPGLHKQLVLKLFVGELDAPALKQFVDQANLLLEFAQHPHIINVMQLGFIDQQPFMLMPYYPQTLNELLALHSQKISFLTSLGFIKQLLLALQPLHSLNVVHLDIKPQNIYLDESNNLALADFDNASVINDSPLFKRFHGNVDQAQEHQLKRARLTPEYASPEQGVYASKPRLISEASDIYSVGALWFRMLVGKTPYEIQSNSNNIDINKRFLYKHLQEIAPAWAIEIMSDLLASDIQARPSCNSCVDHIQQCLKTPHDNQTIHAEAIETFPKLSQLQQEINTILLSEGWVSSDEQARLMASYQLKSANANQNINKDLLKEQQFGLQQVISQCERELTEQHNLSAWFGWINYIQILLKKSQGNISLTKYQQMLQVGRASRPDSPVIAKTLLDKHFQVSKGANYLRGRFLLPILAIALVLLYWTQIAQNDKADSEVSSKPSVFGHSSSKVVVDDKEFVQNKSGLGLEDPKSASPVKENEVSSNTDGTDNIPDFFDKQTSELTGTYHFVVESKREKHSVYVDWLVVKQLPNVRVMSTEVTNALYDLCIKDGACGQTKQFSTTPSYSLNDIGEFPKVNLSWYEITQQFIPWINRQTDSSFSLPSYSQWQTFSQSANAFNGNKALAHCKDCSHPLVRQYANGTMPVKALNADESGLFHVYGNAQEWLSSCWQQQSLDAHTIDRCDQAIVAGGSWLSKQSDLKNQPITQLLKTAKTPTTGFRLVELLNE